MLVDDPSVKVIFVNYMVENISFIDVSSIEISSVETSLFDNIDVKTICRPSVKVNSVNFRVH